MWCRPFRSSSVPREMLRVCVVGHEIRVRTADGGHMGRAGAEYILVQNQGSRRATIWIVTIVVVHGDLHETGIALYGYFGSNHP
ncbi:hypothetical protein PISMIDRAFT_293344 [Pisolithus microcarpus 441]|uniref:Uncharacterized protein n=1 Tax=Pisolithus microcarpus 441 TaxID=765257 RepID=A0A0C9YZ33_9AGAM|nr:hypothetical protein PISMIDRAFT_293344 [Pisolithus microcarpus 441]